MQFILKTILILLTCTAALWAKGDAVIRKSSDFATMQDELSKLRESTDSKNQLTGELNKLWSRAQRIAEMNDKCGTISINDVLDESCSRFFSVDLPEFELEFMNVTGEIRLDNMSKTITGARNTGDSINLCSDALEQFFLNPEQLTSLKLNTDPAIDQLDRNGTKFSITYDFTLSFDKKKLRAIKRLAEIWITNCGDIVVKKKTQELHALFMNNMKEISLAAKADAKLDITGNVLAFHGANRTKAFYNLGNKELFSTASHDLGYYLIIDLNPGQHTASNTINPLSFDGMETFRANGLDNIDGKLIWGSHNTLNPASDPDDDESENEVPDEASSSSEYEYTYDYYSSGSDYSGDYSYVDESSSSYAYDYSDTDKSSSYSDGSTTGHSENSGFTIRGSVIGGINMSMGTLSEEFIFSRRPDLAFDIDVKNRLLYALGMVHLDVGSFTVGIGGGLAKAKALTEGGNDAFAKPYYDLDYYDYEDEDASASSIRLMLAGEIGFVRELPLSSSTPDAFLSEINISGGLRGTYVFDSDYAQTRISLFVELGALGFEFGYESIKNFWKVPYVGAYLRFPTKSMLNFIHSLPSPY